MAKGKPIVGITTGAREEPKTGDPFGRVVLRREYVDRVIAAGGVPVLIPPGADGAELADAIDGLILSGGNDMDASHFGQPNHPSNTLDDPRRFETEKMLWQRLPKELPVFGICYGCQFINIVHGGTLHQHLPDILGEDRHSGDPTQDYSVVQDSKLARVLGDFPARGKSSHHQAIDQVGDNLRVVARHSDGTVEAIETTDGRWVVAVQWHPERSEEPASVALFSAFVAAAARYREEKDSCGTW